LPAFIQARQVHEVRHLLQRHRRLAVLQVHDEAVAGVAQARQVELLQGQPLALLADGGAQLDGGADGRLCIRVVTER